MDPTVLLYLYHIYYCQEVYDPTVLLYLYHIYYCQEVYGPNCTPLSLSYLLLSGSI